jgi:prolipoprotein diacylglyceryltransferase
LFRKRKFDGQVFTAYLLGYAALRFGMEFLRDDGRGRMWFNTLTSGQGISILLLIVGVALWIILKDKVNIVVERAISKKRRLVAFALCFFAGFIGAHRFYVGKTTSGTIQFLTLGGLGIWVIVDMILILTGSFTDKDDKIVSNWE